MCVCQNIQRQKVLVRGSTVARFDWSAECIQVWPGRRYNTHLVIIEWSWGLSSIHSDLLLDIGQKL